MSGDEALAAVAGSLVGGAAAWGIGFALLRRPPSSLVRLNYRGERVPAVLGNGVAAGGILGSLAGALVAGLVDVAVGRTAWAALVVLVLLGAGGAADDLRGDERARGFKGHIVAAFGGRLTGGFVKILAGGAAGLAAGFLVASGRAAIEIALLVALTANLLNLFDRAPGRASKVSLALALPLIALGAVPWTIASSGLWAGAAASLPADLRERAMLGDTGANPMGGMIGLGLGVSLGEPARLVALAAILALNAASEKWSFSKVIEGNTFLRSLDRVGR